MADGSARVSFPWGDATYEFRLPIEQLRELQDKTGAGPLELHRRIVAGHWRVDDLREVIRLGLIGGGLKPPEALKLVERYVQPPVPLMDSVEPASRIIMAALVGPEDDPSGKRVATTDQKSPTTPSASSPSPPSSEPGPQ